MQIPYINIHSHKAEAATPNSIALRNIIVSKDYLPPYTCTAGIHPWFVDLDADAQFAALTLFAQQPQVIAVGECGLDKLSDVSWERQLHIFQRQIQLSEDLEKPLIIHCVKAFQECIALLNKRTVIRPVLFHGFQKNLILAAQLIHEGFYLSLGPALLNGHKDDLIRTLPINKIFLETDDKNADIEAVYAYYARVRNIDLPTLKHQMLLNYNSFFSIDTNP